jgi:hypothetical protein
VLAAGAVPAFAQQSGVVRLDFFGPGGHSSNNYGRTSALHAAGRTAINIQRTLPPGSYVMTDLTGGNSVNSIASDGLIELRLVATSANAYQGLVALITMAADAGVKAENDFRSVKPGDLTAGAPATIRYTLLRPTGTP